ncbi:MAG: folate-binding protein [Actinomycetota bacterium]|nr:folate-binding protein [Actinomycetota bacterium]
MRSPLLELPGAVANSAAGDHPAGPPAEQDPAGPQIKHPVPGHPVTQNPGTPAPLAPDPDSAISWHYGDPIAEQRAAVTQSALFDLSHRDVLTVTGVDRLSWLHTLTSQALDTLPDGGVTEALVLSPTGHVEHHAVVTAVGDTVYLDTEPGHGAALIGYLKSMIFWSTVELATADLGLLRLTGPERVFVGAPSQGATVSGAAGFVRSRADAIEIAVPRADLGKLAAAIIAGGARPAGSWAADALRIPTRVPRLGVDTDERTIPNETSWLASAVHLDKGCYRGQETVARVNNLGRPPRRLVMLNLDGSVDRLPHTGSEVLTAGTAGGGRVVGRVGTVAYHHENGPIALAMVKRSLPLDTRLMVDGVDAMIDPDDAVAADNAGPAPRSAVDHRSLPRIRPR